MKGRPENYPMVEGKVFKFGDYSGAILLPKKFLNYLEVEIDDVMDIALDTRFKRLLILPKELPKYKKIIRKIRKTLS